MANGEVTVGTLAADGRYGAGGVSNDEVTVGKQGLERVPAMERAEVGGDGTDGAVLTLDITGDQVAVLCLDERGATQICATSQTDIIDPEDSGGEPFAAKFIAVAVLLALAIASFQL